MRLGAAAVTLLVTTAALPVRASLFDTFGFGSRGTALGGAFVASSVDYDAVYYNPAALLSRKETHLGLGLNGIVPSLDLWRLSGEEGLDVLLPGGNAGLHLGVSTPIGGVFRDRLAFGVVLYNPVLKFTRLESIDPTFPYFYRYQNLPDKQVLSPALAAELLPWLRIGGGIQVLADFGGRVYAAVSLGERRFTEETIDVDLAAVASPTAGVHLGPFGGFRLGATWRSPLELAYDIPIEVFLEEIGLLSVEVHGTSLYTPGQLAAGLAWESSAAPLAGVSAEVGLTWERWHLAPPAGAAFSLVLDDRVINGGQEGGPKPLAEAYAEHIPLGARDTVTPRAGVEWRPRDGLAFRAGYAWRPTPLPSPAYQTNTLDATAHLVSFGFGFVFRDPTRVHRVPLHVDLGVQATLLEDRTVVKAATGNPDGAYAFGGALWNLLLDVRHDF